MSQCTARVLRDGEWLQCTREEHPPTGADDEPHEADGVSWDDTGRLR
jgi:hypothetical protein